MALTIPTAKITTDELRPVLQPQLNNLPAPINPLGGAEKLANAVQNHLIREKKENDQIVANNAVNDLREFIQVSGYGDGQDSRGYYGNQGLNATTALKGYNDGNESRSELLSKSMNRQQKKLYNVSASQILLKSAGRSLDYSETQRRGAITSSLNSSIANSVRGAETDYTDLGLNYSLGRNAVFDKMNHNGSAPEIVKEELSNFDNKFYSSAVYSALAHNDLKTARVIFDEHKDKISALKRKALNSEFKKISKIDEEKNTLGIAQWILDNNYDSNLSLNDNLNIGKSISDPKVRKQYESMAKAAHQNDKTSRADESARVLEANYGSKIDTLSPEARSLLSNSDKELLKKSVLGTYDDDNAEYYFSTLKSTDFNDRPASQILNEVGLVVSPKALKKLNKIRLDSLNGIETANLKAYKQAMSSFDSVFRAEIGSKIKGTDPRYNQAKVNAQLLASKRVKNAIIAKEEAGKSLVLSPEETNKIMSGVMYSGSFTKKGWVYDSDVEFRLIDFPRDEIENAIEQTKGIKTPQGKTREYVLLQYIKNSTPE